MLAGFKEKEAERDCNMEDNFSDNKAPTTRTQLGQKQMRDTEAISDCSGKVMERKSATNKGNKQDVCQDDRAVLVGEEGSLRGHLLLDDGDDGCDRDEVCIVASSDSAARDNDNQVNEGNFVIREQQIRDDDYYYSQTRSEETGEEAKYADEVKKSDATYKEDAVERKFCLKSSKIVETFTSKYSGSEEEVGRLKDGEGKIDEILDDEAEALKSETKIVGSNVCGQVTDKSSLLASSKLNISQKSHSKEASSPISSLCFEAAATTALDKLSLSSSKSGAIQNVQQKPMQMSLDKSRRRVELAQELEEVVASSEMDKPRPQLSGGLIEHSACSLCNYLNSILHHQQCYKLNSSDNLNKFASSLVNNDSEQRSQIELDEKLELKQRQQQQQQQNLPLEQFHQVEHGNEPQFQVLSSTSSSSIKPPRELDELSIWNNLKANLSADVYKYELEANLMIRRPTSGSNSGCSHCCNNSGCFSARDNDRNDESGIMADISCAAATAAAADDINNKVQAPHMLHALNNQASQLLHNDQNDDDDEKGENKIDRALCDTGDKVVPSVRDCSKVGSLVMLSDSSAKVSSGSQKGTTKSSNTEDTIRKVPAFKCLRGLSLDSNNRNKLVQNSTRTFGKRLNSRRLLINQGKSQSTKLILIKSNNASYTIQGK